jgi:hypothetical protein
MKIVETGSVSATPTRQFKGFVINLSHTAVEDKYKQ